MTIGELSAAGGVPASTIRYWERIGVLPKPARSSSQRRYGPDAVNRLHVLRLAQACGFHLDEMRHLLHGFEGAVPASRRWQEMARKKQVELDEQMERIRTMKRMVDSVLKCQCGDLLECGRRAAAVLGT
jgi:DNA-binding transcriptional MerR regulator